MGGSSRILTIGFAHVALALAIIDAPYTFERIDVPGQGLTVATGVNNSGVVCGYYAQQVAGVYHAFVRDANGAIATFDYPGSAMTAALGINDSGQIVGYYTQDLTSGDEFAFLRDAAGNMITFGVQRVRINSASGIDNSGQTVVNSLMEPSPNFPVFREVNGAYAVISVPGFTTIYVYGLNNGGVSVGQVYNGVSLAFISTADGTGPTATFSFPGSTTATVARGINDLNTIVGTYTLGFRGFESVHGYIRDSNGDFEYLDVPGAVSTGPYGINNLYQIVGSYGDSTGEHGFLAVPARLRRGRY